MSAHSTPCGLTLADFDYSLPPDRIALRPLADRLAARQLIIPPSGPFRDSHIRDLPTRLQAGDCLVLNDTKVMPVYIRGRVGMADVSAHLLEPCDDTTWWAFVKNARRLGPQKWIDCGQGVRAEPVQWAEDGRIALRFVWERGSYDDLADMFDAIGAMPLPPYILARRAVDVQDRRDYQTIFAARQGAVAAPTASLHFTPDLLAMIAARGVACVRVTLHVGAGTFLPVKTERIDDHVMHAEWAEIDANVSNFLNQTRRAGGRIVAVGTTALRVLESAVDANGHFSPHCGKTSIFIRPGHIIAGADVLMTNFHQPKSTLMMLVAAAAGLDRIRAAYQHALDQGYRFLSYGDSCWIDIVRP